MLNLCADVGTLSVLGCIGGLSYGTLWTGYILSYECKFDVAGRCVWLVAARNQGMIIFPGVGICVGNLDEGDASVPGCGRVPTASISTI